MDSIHEVYPDAATGDTTSQPLKGIIVCCTNVSDEKRAELNAQAKQMGASVQADLGVEVTHLVVGHWDSPKYHHVARFRPDIRPMTMDWIATVRNLWINDQDIDMDLLERQHMLHTLTSLRISLTGCDDMAERQDIAEKIKANGGEYDGNLTKQITHLISYRTEGNKYKAAKSWGLRIVSAEWLLDTLERGMILDEKYYDPSLPIEERGKGSWDKNRPRINSSKKRAREQTRSGVEEGKRKLRRTASTKLNTQSQSIWGDIVGSGNKIQVSRGGIWDTSDSFAPAEKELSEKSKEVTPPKAKTLDLVQEPDQPVGGIFYECRFWIHGFSAKHTQILGNHLVAHDGKVLQNESDLSAPNARKRTYVIVPFHLPTSKYPNLSSEVEIITDWWVERCLQLKKYLEPEQHVLGRPFPKFPIEGFSDLKISSAAFTGIDILHVKRTTELLGGTYSEDMTPQSSVLVTKSIVNLRKDKLEHAQEWKIPIVTADWLWDCIKSGTKLPFAKYRYRAKKQPASAPISKKESIPTHVSNPERTSHEDTGSKSRSSTLPSRSSSKPIRIAPLDESAFAPLESNSTPIKDEQDSVPLPIHLEPESSELTPPPPSKPEPLSEIPLNSHSANPTPTTDLHLSTTSEIPEQKSIDISSLLAKTKRPSCSSVSISNAKAITNDQNSNRPRQPRGKAIIGRALSNVSTASLASSVDSTATSGPAVIYPRPQESYGNHGSQDEINEFMNLQGDREKFAKEFPPATQLGYSDKEGEEHRMMVQGIMEGKEKETIEKEMSVVREKERAKKGLGRKGTVGDFSNSEVVAGKGGGSTRTSGRTRRGG
ncbi:ef129d1f-124e-4c31-b5f6-0ba0fdc66998 [Sclerotinia trifoliorum]|uniref:Ef129d1f-124e-4c31-b5f6-0ba0fdc66998 n=1 Tax=Sclerotinia trifoliorum TaxID=28548 RepID=A0A8H2VTD5_9HELO|nr:ef129d1f-124e-4c31-b5f6-0ba0fdc66998 [Sclerotinia trifoliorum]